MKKYKKILIIAAFVIAVLIIGNAYKNSSSKSNTTSTKATLNVIETTIELTEVTTEKPTEAPTEKPTEAPTEPPTEKPTEKPTVKPIVKPTEATTQIVFINYTNEVNAGSNASVTIQGAPNTIYYIDVVYKSGSSKAEGLEPKTSDNNGLVTWEWEVGARTTPGTYKISVSGGGDYQSVDFIVN